MVLPPRAVGNPMRRMAMSLSRSGRMEAACRRISWPGLRSRQKAIPAGTALDNTVARAAPAEDMPQVIISSGANTRFSEMPTRFSSMGRKVSPWAWRTAW